MCSFKKYALTLLGCLGVALLATAALMFYFDPYFHFHAPYDGVHYVLQNQRYQNNGITRHFEYDAMITGTSMTENFKTSQLDDLFGTNSIKTSFSGATFKEINEGVARAASYNPDLKMVIRGLDLYNLDKEKNFMMQEGYPEYLYDDIPWNDISYLFNKDILLNDLLPLTILPTLTNKPSTSFDEYSNWMYAWKFGAEYVLTGYTRPEVKATEKAFTEADKTRVAENITQNAIDIAKENPDITFYYFYPPYSTVYFDTAYRENTLSYQIDVLEYASSLLLEQENIKLFAFYDWYDVITDLSYYKDWIHYSEEVNAMILEAMNEGEHQLTAKNYQAYFDEMKDFYQNYDYESIFTA